MGGAMIMRSTSTSPSAIMSMILPAIRHKRARVGFRLWTVDNLLILALATVSLTQKSKKTGGKTLDRRL
jgi:hypothetical protein